MPDPGPTLPPALELRGVDKRFGAVHANRAVSLRIARGAIHGLVGENGAGKSTLMNIVYGFHRADAGEILVEGRRVRLRHPEDAIAAGIGMVHQHFRLVDNFTVLENVVLGAEGGRRLARGLAAARQALSRLARDYALEVPIDAPVEDLAVGLQQRVEILKALYRGARILILDEPTAVLSPAEADRLFAILRVLRGAGKTVIFVTHKLREILAATDRVTVMRQGAVAADFATAQTSAAELAETMMGRAVALRTQKGPASPGPVRLRVRGLDVRDRWGVRRVKGVSLEVRAGEIVGIAGVAGNGQSELLEALAGLRRPSAGEIWLPPPRGPGARAPWAWFAGGQSVDRTAGLPDLVPTPAAEGPRARRERGLGHIPEDRLRVGVMPRFSAEDNAILGYQDRPVYRRAGLLNRGAIRRECLARMAAWDVRPAEPERRLAVFSGGNQQKLILAREVEAGHDVLIVGQPTRGVDIGGIEFIHRRLIALRDAGKALLIVSAELDEILGLADRVVVMAGGEIAGELSGAEATEEKLGLLMAGIRAEPGPAAR
ncbi:MAG: ABC transporter ATP-binding protein [Opitutaceae bacterium]